MFPYILAHDTSFRFHACGMIPSVVPASHEIIELCTNNVNDIYIAQPVDAKSLRRYRPQFLVGRRRRNVKKKKGRDKNLPIA